MLSDLLLVLFRDGFPFRGVEICPPSFSATMPSKDPDVHSHIVRRRRRTRRSFRRRTCPSQRTGTRRSRRPEESDRPVNHGLLMAAQLVLDSAGAIGGFEKSAISIVLLLFSRIRFCLGNRGAYI